MKRLALSLLMSVAGVGGAAAWTSPAPDVVLYCTPALEGALGEVADKYTASSHVAVHVFVAPPDGLLGLLKHRARDDVVVADDATIQRLAADGLVRAGTPVQLGKDPYVLIGNDDATLPDGDGAAALLAAHATVLPDPTTASSFDGAAVLHAAVPGAAYRTIGVADTWTVVARVRDDRDLLGLVQRTESGGAHVRKIADLQAAPMAMAGALVTQGQSGNAAAFLAFVAGADGKAILLKAGLETGS